MVEYLNLDKLESNYNQFSLEIFTLNKFMKLDLAAMNALNIFNKGILIKENE